ncbi:MAG: hypothetical protein KBH45_19445 [Verrucomicrobia bacterium]|nr:hypothetical protein [Verrucomicrobiota bacterium]
MDASQPTAWEPLTPLGVAAFARAPLRRLLLVQCIVALVVGVTVAWLLRDAYFPTIGAAIAQLPAAGEIRSGKMDWRGESPRLLAEGTFLAFTVDLEHAGEIRSPAQIQIEFGKTNLLLHSLLGYTEVGYPKGWIIAVNRTELSPLWGAWRPWLLVGSVGGVAVYLLASWWVLATIYCGPVWLIGFFANRDLGWRASWRLANAALLPGAFVMILGLSFYDLGALDLVRLAFVFVAHLVVGWIYIGVGLFFVPRLADLTRPTANPFGSARK